MRQNYWDVFYASKEKEIPSEPSGFAKIISHKLDKDDLLLELGCGNGRDSMYLTEYCKFLLAIDNSEKTIEKLQQLQHERLKFLKLDIREIGKLQYNPTVVYSRFFLHSIDEETEEKLFNWLAKTKHGTRFICECRSEKDLGLFKYYGNTHYRRGIVLDNLTQRLTDIGFSIEESIESRGLSVYREEDPYIIRIIARK